MISRRDWLVGAGCAAAFTAAEVLRPRRTLNMMPAGSTLATIVPRRIAGFHEGGSGSLVLPPSTQGSLSQRLYGDQLGRIYQADGDSQTSIMLLIAYGAAQTDALQLHRPENCYPAFGFKITDRRFVNLRNPLLESIPAVALTAVADRHTEDIVYWTRVGRELPRTSEGQRLANLRTAMEGYIGDGVLVRASAVRIDGKPIFDELSAFLEALISAGSPVARIALIGR
jgi:EpsI family protein